MKTFAIIFLSFFISTNAITQSNLYEPNLELIQQALSQKQRILDSRRLVLKGKADEIRSIVEYVRLHRSSEKLTELESAYYSKYINNFNKYANYDLTDDYVYFQILDWVKDQKNYFMSW